VTGRCQQYRRLARKSVIQADLRKYVRRVLKVEDDQEASSRLKNLEEEIVGLAETGLRKLLQNDSRSGHGRTISVMEEAF